MALHSVTLRSVSLRYFLVSLVCITSSKLKKQISDVKCVLSTFGVGGKMCCCFSTVSKIEPLHAGRW